MRFPFLRVAGFILSALVLLGAQPVAPTSAPDLAKTPPRKRTPLNLTLPTIFIAGDSTAAPGRGESQQGWGVPFARYFDSSKVNIANRARGGRSSRTFITEGSWERLLAEVKPGDLVLIQFGHNDGGAINDEPPPPLRARGTLPGLGEETRKIDNVLTKKSEVVHTFGWYLRRYIADTRAKGAEPILLTLTLRNIWHDGKIERGSGRYREWILATAAAEKVRGFDLTSMMADRFDAMGPEKVAVLYPQDHTHFNASGADLHAAAVVAGLRALHPARIDPLLASNGVKID